MPSDPVLTRVVPALAEVPGIAAVALGGSRARGTATASSDYDIGLYFSTAEPLDTDRLLQITRTLVDDGDAAEVTPVGGWGRWIVGGGWLTIDGRKVDLLYRNLNDVDGVIEACRSGEITMDYQPGHPHGFCSAIWMGEVALCRSLHDREGLLAALNAKTLPYPKLLGEALIRRFGWETSFAIENAEIAVARGEQTHIAGCAYRTLACIGQVLFALNARYLINEKGALQEAATFARTLPDLVTRAAEIWRSIGDRDFATTIAVLRALDQDLKELA